MTFGETSIYGFTITRNLNVKQLYRDDGETPCNKR